MTGDGIHGPELLGLLEDLTVERYRPVPPRPSTPPRTAPAAVSGELQDLLPDPRRGHDG